MTSDDLFGPLFVPERMRQAVSGRAWVEAMLAFEAVLASAEAEAGLIPAQAAEAIAAAAAMPDRFDVAALGQAGRAGGNPAAPLVRALTAAVEGDARAHVHLGATSQDVMDTASSLVSRQAVGVIDEQLDDACRYARRLIDAYRDTPMVARTLGQQALPTTFGLRAAGWLDALLDARDELAAVPFAAQLGGAAGTMASLGDQGPRVLALLATGLDLDAPSLPWHTARGRIGRLAGALAVTAGTLEKIATDVVGLAQTEVGEVAEGGHGGGSSTRPHKSNPAGSAVAIACAHRVRGEAAILFGTMAQQHERSAGAWQAEWQAVSGALAATGGAAAAVRGVLRELEVRPGRMRANLDLTGGLVMTEAVVTALVGAGAERQAAHDAVAEIAASGQDLRQGVLADGRLSEAQVDAALDP
ncbi:MAG TPA: lyase family protein, partial [Thermoleophilaceae bacterium]|nr:lyase family protein [Thermoleophilaceae bacterium]